MGKGRKQPAVWSGFLRGGMLALGVYVLLILLVTLLLVKGILPERGQFPAVMAACALSSLAGGLLSVRGSPWGTLPSGLAAAGTFGAVLIAAGLLGWDSGVTWAGRGGLLLLAAVAGGTAAGLLGGKRGRRVKRKPKHR